MTRQEAIALAALALLDARDEIAQQSALEQIGTAA